MSTNGRRAWRKWARAQRRAFGMGFKDAGFSRRHPCRDEAKPIGMKNTRPTPISAKPFASLSLVGMTMSARKRAARLTTLSGQPRRGSRSSERYGLAKFSEGYPLWLEAGRHEYAQQRARYRIGERLRPCPGCAQCRAAPEWIVRAMAKRMGLRVQIRRLNSQVFVGEHTYLAQLHRRGPWNPVIAEGCSRGRAFLNLLDCILREGRDEFRFAECDGSGVLPARPRSVR